MSIDPYSSCPCGSGKNFKWCCQPYYSQVEKALDLFQEGQRDVAMAAIDKLVAQHPDKAPVWGYKAQLLFNAERFEEADEALQKAFSIHSDFPFGHYLRGILRQSEGEMLGALIEFRKAAELYDPKANELLAQINETIADLELRLNHPVAARAALERSRHFNPTNQEVRQIFEAIFGAESRLPQSAKRAYTFRPAAPERHDAWKAALDSASNGRLTAAAKAFEQLIESDAKDAAASFNLGLVRAWLGDHAKATEALQRSIELTDNDEHAAEAAALVEVLTCGQGMVEQSDYRLHRNAFRISDPQKLIAQLQEWEQTGRLIGVQPDQESGSLSALILEVPPVFGEGIGTPVARADSYLFIIGDQMMIWHTNPERVAKVAADLRQKLGAALSEPMSQTIHVGFGDVILEALAFPNQPSEPDAVRGKMAEFAERYFEDAWLTRPLHSLSGLTPVDAAASPQYRKRLGGIIRFLEECFAGAAPVVRGKEETQPLQLYDFNRLRQKLGLSNAVPAAATPSIGTMSVEQLAGLNLSELSDEQLGQAFRAAVQLDAGDLAGHVAKQAVERPVAGSADRHPYFAHLIQQAQSDGDTNRVLAILDQAEVADRAMNEGKRTNDYALKRGQVLAKRGDAEKAYEHFKAIIAATGGETRFIGAATEAMLGQKRGPWALEFAEQGLAKARSRNDRDSEQYFLELVGAAKKLG